MEPIFIKLTSRKLWLAIAGASTGIAIALGINTSDIATVAGAVTAILSVVTYIITEGKVDAAQMGQAVKDVQNAEEVIKNAE